MRPKLTAGAFEEGAEPDLDDLGEKESADQIPAKTLQVPQEGA